MRKFPIFESCEARRLMSAQTLNFSGSSETVVMWTDSSGYTRFGPSDGTTYYFDSTGSNPAGSSIPGGKYRFDSTYTGFTLNLNGGNDAFSIDGDATQGSIQFYIAGGLGNDTINGGVNADTITGNDGLDSIFGGLGNDLVTGGNQNDYLEGSGGNDSVLGGNGNDLLLGGNGNDSLSGDNGTDSFIGGAGDDVMNARNDSNAVDTLDGGAGADSYLVDGYVSGGTAYSYDLYTSYYPGEGDSADILIS